MKFNLDKLNISIVENYHNIDNIVLFIFGALYFGGILILVFPALKRFLVLKKYQYIGNKKARNNGKEESNFDKKIKQTLKAVIGKEISANQFKFMLCGIFLLTFMLSFQVVTHLASLVLSILITAVPCLVLFMLLERKRNKSSTEAEELVSDLLIQYRVCGKDIERAMEEVIAGTASIPMTRKLLANLLSRVRQTADKDEIRKATNEFAYSIKTTWASVLAHNIYVACADNIKIENSLSDIISQLRDARMLEEEKKRLNSETNRIFVFIPITFAGTVIMSLKYCDMSLTDYLDNQFGTLQGIVLIIAIIIMTLISYIMIAMKKNKRFDF